MSTKLNKNRRSVATPPSVIEEKLPKRPTIERQTLEERRWRDVRQGGGESRHSEGVWVLKHETKITRVTLPISHAHKKLQQPRTMWIMVHGSMDGCEYVELPRGSYTFTALLLISTGLIRQGREDCLCCCSFRYTKWMEAEAETGRDEV